MRVNTRTISYSNSLATRPNGLARLWLLRIVIRLGAQKILISAKGFEDEDVAQVLNMSHWYDYSGNEFDPEMARSELREQLFELESQAPHLSLPETFQKNIDQLAQLLNLNEVETRILALMATLTIDPLLADATGWLGDLSTRKVVQVLSVLLDCTEYEIRTALSTSGNLLKTGLIRIAGILNTLPDKLIVFPDNLPEYLQSNTNDNITSLFRDAISTAPTPNLSIDDYGHIGKSLEILRPFLRRAVEQKKRGINIFLHGPPGTGKTQLTRVIAQELGCDLFEVSGEDSDGDSITGEKRLQSYRLAQSLLARRDALILFDEAEDVFNDGNHFFGRKSIAQTRKAWINRSLEENVVPTFWLSNSAACLDPAFIRRFDLVIELPVPPKQHRRQLIEKSCGHLVSQELLSRMVDCEYLSPGNVKRASSVVESIADVLSPPQVSEAIGHLIDSTLIAQDRPPLSRQSANLPGTYDPKFIHADADLIAIAEGISRNRLARLCLYGPPGTGKSAYGRWLAEYLAMPFHLRRASDILSKYVGGTERNLAKTFREAEQENALLLLDEVDSFLQNREGAQRSWEITEVNEMLTQLESYNGILIATTNLMDDLDPASLRRFDLKIKFDYLLPDQAWALLCRHCEELGLDFPDKALRARIASMRSLTPGDFAVVTRQQRFRPAKAPKDYIAALETECSSKHGVRNAAIGFLRHDSIATA